MKVLYICENAHICPRAVHCPHKQQHTKLYACNDTCFLYIIGSVCITTPPDIDIPIF